MLEWVGILKTTLAGIVPGEGIEARIQALTDHILVGALDGEHERGHSAAGSLLIQFKIVADVLLKHSEVLDVTSATAIVEDGAACVVFCFHVCFVEQDYFKHFGLAHTCGVHQRSLVSICLDWLFHWVFGV